VGDLNAAGFSTSEAPARALAYWREMIDATFVPLDVTALGAARDFQGAVRLHDIGELRVAHVRASPMAALHTRRHVNRSSDDDYFLALQLRGLAYAAQDGRRVALRAGDLALFDSTRPYAFEFHASGSFEHVIYRIPRLALDARGTALGSATAIRVARDAFEGRLVSPYLATLSSAARPAREHSAHGLSASALDLLALALGSIGRRSTHDRRGPQPTLARIQQQTLARLCDPDLCPADVAAASYVSVRQLHRLFAAAGTTFCSFLREARLSRCREDLADPRLGHLPIAKIAARRGCSNAAHFSRMFTARYGSTPRAFRAAGLER
jgi:AraC-like DNA-binding protein